MQIVRRIRKGTPMEAAMAAIAGVVMRRWEM